VQQGVSFGTNLCSEEEGSTGMSCPPGSMMKLLDSGMPQILHPNVHAESLVNNPGPDRGGERTKRERSSPYKCLKRTAKDTLKTASEKEVSGAIVTNEDQVMKEDDFGVHTLALFPT
jgi:hypothetical protein